MAKKKVKQIEYGQEALNRLSQERKDNPNAELLLLLPEDDDESIDFYSRSSDAKKKKKQKISKEDDPEGRERTKRISIVVFLLVGIISLICSWYFLGNGDDLVFGFVCVLVSIWGFGIAFLLLFNKRMFEEREEEVDLFGDLTDNEKRSAILTVIAIGLAIGLFILYYVVGLDRLWTAWGIWIILATRLLAHVVDKLSDSKKYPKEYTEFKRFDFVSQSIILIILLLFVIHILMGNDLLVYLKEQDETINTMNAQFTFAMILIAMSGIIGMQEIIQDFNRTKFMRYVVMIILPLLTISIYPISEAQLKEGMVSGAIANYNWFNSVYLAILRSPHTQFTLVLIMISALTIIIGKARGQSGGGLMVIGALGIAGIPMLITIMAFVGQVPAPDVFYDLFGEGFGELIFSISYVSIISLVLALVGVFYEIVPSAVSGTLD